MHAWLAGWQDVYFLYCFAYLTWLLPSLLTFQVGWLPAWWLLRFWPSRLVSEQQQHWMRMMTMVMMMMRRRWSVGARIGWWWWACRIRCCCYCYLLVPWLPSNSILLLLPLRAFAKWISCKPLWVRLLLLLRASTSALHDDHCNTAVWKDPPRLMEGRIMTVCNQFSCVQGDDEEENNEQF